MPEMMILSIGPHRLSGKIINYQSKWTDRYHKGYRKSPFSVPPFRLYLFCRNIKDVSLPFKEPDTVKYLS